MSNKTLGYVLVVLQILGIILCSLPFNNTKAFTWGLFYLLWV